MQEECRFGDNCFRPDCKYKHKPRAVKNVACIHFQGKGCLQGDHCPYLHIHKSPQKPTDHKNIPCMHFLGKGCIQGDRCPYSHAFKGKATKPPPSETSLSNIVMQLNPTIPSTLALPCKRNASESVNLEEKFPEDISAYLELNDNDESKAMKIPKISPEEVENNENRAIRIFQEALLGNTEEEENTKEILGNKPDAVDKETDMVINDGRFFLEGKKEVPKEAENNCEDSKIAIEKIELRKAEGNEVTNDFSRLEHENAMKVNEEKNETAHNEKLEEMVAKSPGSKPELTPVEAPFPENILLPTRDSLVMPYKTSPTIAHSPMHTHSPLHTHSPVHTHSPLPKLLDEPVSQALLPKMELDQVIKPLEITENNKTSIEPVLKSKEAIEKPKNDVVISFPKVSDKPVQRNISLEKTVKSVVDPDKTVSIAIPRKPSSEKTTRILTLEEIKERKKLEAKKKEEQKEQAAPETSPVRQNLQKEPTSDVSHSLVKAQNKTDHIKKHEVKAEPHEIFLPVKRKTIQEIKEPVKSTKTEPKKFDILVCDEEWEPYKASLMNLDFSQENFSPEEIEECKKIAMKISTPEGLSELIFDLEQKLNAYPGVPVDPEFESLTLSEKVDRLYQEVLRI